MVKNYLTALFVLPICCRLRETVKMVVVLWIIRNQLKNVWLQSEVNAKFFALFHWVGQTRGERKKRAVQETRACLWSPGECKKKTKTKQQAGTIDTRNILAVVNTNLNEMMCWFLCPRRNINYERFLYF